MKKPILKLTFLILILVLITSVCLTSCGVLKAFSGIADIYGSIQDYEDIGGNPPSDENNSGNEGNKDSLPPSNIVIEGAGASDVAYAASAGLRSSVNVCARFGSTGTSTGSGVIFKLDSDGSSCFIITNFHVVYYNNSISNDISVFLFGMQSGDYVIPATYVGGSAYYDIAVLRVQSSELLSSCVKSGSVAAVTIADSDGIMAGQTAIAIGAPGVSDSSVLSSIAVTSGVVSVDSEYITMTSVNGISDVKFRVVRIDTAVNSGNSGGGLFNSKGELIGIVNAKITKTDVENIAYAIPSNVAKAVANNIVDYCYGKSCKSVMRAMMGVTVEVSKLSTVYDKESGILRSVEEISIQAVEKGTLSDGALMAGDIVKSVKIGEKTIEVTRMHHLIDTMLDARVGDEVITTVIRNGAQKEVKIIITQDCLTEY